MCILNLPTQLCCLQLWLRLCAQACPGLQVSRHKIKPCQPADFSAKPAFLLLSNGCFATAWLLVVCVDEQMSTQLVAVVIARKETVTEEAEAEVPSFLQLSAAVFVRWCSCPCFAAVGVFGGVAEPALQPDLALPRSRTGLWYQVLSLFPPEKHEGLWLKLINLLFCVSKRVWRGKGCVSRGIAAEGDYFSWKGEVGRSAEIT